MNDIHLLIILIICVVVVYLSKPGPNVTGINLSTPNTIMILITVLIIIVILYLTTPSKSIVIIKSSSTVENFDSLPQPPIILPANPSGMEISPIASEAYPNPLYAGPDSETIAKLKRTIQADNSRETQTKLAYNDVSAYKPGGFHPYNISNAIISQNQSEDPVTNADQFHNSYYSLWDDNQKSKSALVSNRADEIVDMNATCVNFKNVNQCMSVCSASPNCKGFYIDKTGVENKCCMMINPLYNTNRHSYDKLPNNINTYGLRTINKEIEQDGQDGPDGKLVFEYIRKNDQNSTYKTDLTRAQCKNICPKCIMGRCPENYRCANMIADPRYNYSCMITNEDRYDENKPGQNFDSNLVPYLDDKYGLDEYAGYNPNVERQVSKVPESERYYLADGIIPTNDESQSAFTTYDEEHIGPRVSHPVFDKNYDLQKASKSVDQIGIRGGNDPVGIMSNYRRGPYYPTNRTIPRVNPNKDIPLD